MAERVYPESGNRNIRYGYPRGGAPNGTYYNMKEQQPQKARPLPPPPAQEAYDGGYYRPRRNVCCICLLWAFALLVVLLLLLGIAVLIFFLVVHPKAPKYDVQDLRLSSFSITPTGSLQSGVFQLSAVTSYAVEARNPNKKIGIYYDNININVQSEGVSIGKGSVPAFYQGHRNTTIISGQLSSSNLPLASNAGYALESARNSGSIPLYVTVDVRARIKMGKWKSPHFWVHVRCNVDVNPDQTSGSQVLHKSCSVKR